MGVEFASNNCTSSNTSYRIDHQYMSSRLETKCDNKAKTLRTNRSNNNLK